MKLVLSAVIVLLSLSSAPAYAQDVLTGIDAYELGDYETALSEWRPLAEQGDASAQASLGLLYALGHGVPRDFDEAIKWFRLSADQGHPIGQNNLAVMYQNGYGVPQDYVAAATLYRRSALQGYAVAQYGLGSLFENGLGVEPDFEEAYFWYTLAAKNGHKHARQARLTLGLQLSAKQKIAAMTRYAKFEEEYTAAPALKSTSPVDLASPPKLIEGAPSEATALRPSEPVEPPAEVVARLAPLPAKTGVEESNARAGAAPWRIQIASLSDQTKVEAEWKRLQQAHPDLLDGLTLHIQKAELSKGTFYRVQAEPLVDRKSAVSLCSSLKSRNQDCLVVAP